MNRSSATLLIIGLCLGVVLGALGLYFVMSLVTDTHIAQKQDYKNNKPLYWVAPMDPNFKRDKPGKSPMGMDLVPVYAESESNDSPGTVEIDPVMVNNLGIKTITVSASSPTESIRTFGKVAFAEDAIVHIHPRVEGWIETLSVRNEGEYIEKGDPLYSMYAPELVNAQEELLIALTQNNQALISAAKARLMALNAPTSLIDSIQKNRNVERTIMFYAPQSGYVSTLNIQEGFYVTPSTTMLAIANMERVWVLADIFARDASKIEVGQSALVTSEHIPGAQIDAQIDYVYPTLNTKTRTLTARLVVDNADLMLKPEMFTTVLINAPANQSDKEHKLIAVPHQAIIRTGEANRVVLALGEGKFKSINLVLGTVFDNVVEVIDGLKEGDEIVVSAQFLLDSESSISSDFMRMSPANHGGMSNSSDGKEKTTERISAWTSATVNEILLEKRMVNLTHGPLDAFNMMGMTMNFMVAEHIDIRQFKVSQNVHVEIIKTPAGMYSIETVHFTDTDKATHNHSPTEKDTATSDSHSDMDHSEHKNHGGDSQ